MALKNMPHFDDIETGDDESKKEKPLKNTNFSFNIGFSDPSIQSALSTWNLTKDIPGINELISQLGSVPMGFLDNAQNLNDVDKKINEILDNLTPEAQIALDKVMEVFDTTLKGGSPIPLTGAEQLLATFLPQQNSKEKIDEDDIDEELSEIKNLINDEDAISDDYEDDEMDFQISDEDDNSMLDTTDEFNESEHSIFSQKMEELIKQEDVPFSLAYEPFTIRQLENSFPGLVDDMEEAKFNLSHFNSILDSKITSIYDSCTVLNENISNEMKSLTFMMFVSEIGDDFYLPAYFTLYYDGSSFKAYVHKEHNPIDLKNNVLTIEDLMDKKTYDNLMESEDKPSKKGIYRDLYHFFELSNFIPVDPILKNVFIDKSGYPISTINELGTFTSLETEYEDNGLFYIGDIELDKSYDVKYFLSDYDLTPIDNKLKVYAIFSHNENLSKKQIKQIEESFNSKFIETNDSFKRYVSIEPCGKNGVIIKFYNL